MSRSQGGTVMHTRRFLSYHGDRFDDESLCLWSEPGARLEAVLPLARSPGDAEVVVSHPGSTFGGLIEPSIDPARRAGLLAAAAGILLDRGYRRLAYKPAPAIFGAQFDESDLRLMTHVGQVRRCNLWNFIRLDHHHELAPKRRASVKAASRKGVTVRQAQGDDEWLAFHALLTANLASRHAAAPVHSAEEMLLLRQRIAGENEMWLAFDRHSEIVAGTWCFAYNRRVLHTQYIASSPKGRELGGVDSLLAAVIDDAGRRGLNALSFGINTLADGFQINSNLLKQKLRFGGGVAACWQFDVDLARLAHVDPGFA
ncbi:GNAT family N-acetyltransferase [Erythrobacter sp. WG]|uniref:GNAT family N-acetyltransferase n=1 Tax=Erythrobacter sp. WG TaxID=2985510 RepID=UPI00226DE723|nr:GNAT family N-acetyltransferase [Erythrobacter sp. WG]MCX9148591.1 GNAT family N-acetyltransferase [Erythrobacter sp. WG]